MVGTRVASPVFHEGDEVVLAEGPYQGALGVFLRQKTDVNWADITERNGSVRSHPVEWLAHATSATPGFDARSHPGAEYHNA
jgi:hypothetical protein